MKNSENEISNIDYSLSPFKSKRFILGSFFILTFVLASGLKGYINFFQGNTFKLNASCTIHYSDPKVSFFLPKITLSKLVIPSSCLGRGASTLNIEKPIINFNLLSFSPFGLKFLVEAEVLRQKLEVDIVAGFSGLSLLINNDNGPVNSINLRDLAEFTSPISLDGDIKLSTIFASLTYSGKLEDFAANLASDNLVIPSQNIMGFKLDVMNINKILIQLNMLDDSKIHLKKFIVGDDKSPLVAQFAGEVIINKRNPKFSGLQLAGEFKLSDKILAENELIEGLLSRFDKKDKYYQIVVDGTVTNPKFDSKR